MFYGIPVNLVKIFPDDRLTVLCLITADVDFSIFGFTLRSMFVAKLQWCGKIGTL